VVDYRSGFWVARPALADWTVEVLAAGEFRATGQCPRCRHMTGLDVSDVVNEPRLVEDDLPEAEKTRQATCACNQNHPKAEGKRGCGALWLVGLAQGDDGWVVVTGNPDVRDAAAALDAAVTAESTNLTTTAEKWLPGIAALYGLFGLAGLATASDDVGALDTSIKWLVAGFGIAGLVATAVAIVLAYQAAYGWPTESDVSTDAKLLEWHRNRRVALASRAGNMKASVVGALLATVFLTVAVGLIWFGPDTPTPKPEVIVVYDGGSVCGTIEEPDEGEVGVVTINHATSGGTEDQEIPVGDIETITPGSCDE
jgi:hypothetical protein